MSTLPRDVEEGVRGALDEIRARVSAIEPRRSWVPFDLHDDTPAAVLRGWRISIHAYPDDCDECCLHRQTITDAIHWIAETCQVSSDEAVGLVAEAIGRRVVDFDTCTTPGAFGGFHDVVPQESAGEQEPPVGRVAGDLDHDPAELVLSRTWFGDGWGE